MVATVLSRLGLEARPGWDQESRAYARAEQEQSDFEKAKESVDEGQPVYESKKRVATRPYDGTGGKGDGRWKAREEGQSRDEEKQSERKREIWWGKGKDEEKGAAIPGAILLEFK